jgi:hypothetical protein
MDRLKGVSQLYGGERVRAMLNDSGVEKDFKNKLWAECALTASKLSNLIVRTKEGSPFELFYGRKLKVGKNLRIFGEIGIKITRAQVHHEKLNNKGNECIFVGYEDNHSQDAYRVFDLKNKTIMIARNVRWLGRTFGEYFKVAGEKNLDDTSLVESDDEEEFITIRGDIREVPKVEPSRIITRSRALLDALEESSSSSEDEGEEGNFMAANFEIGASKKCIYHPDEGKRKLWREGIKKEISSMEQRGVWNTVSIIFLLMIPINHHLILVNLNFMSLRKSEVVRQIHPFIYADNTTTAQLIKILMC